MYKSVIKVILLGCLLINTASVFAGKYIKVSNSGESLPDTATVAEGWACTYDTEERRLWEVKTDDGGMRDKDWSYSWGDETQYASSCEKDEFCNTNNYKMRVNATKLCGVDDWHLPNRTELKSLIYCSSGQPELWNSTGNRCKGVYLSPTINTEFFPNTGADYWSTETLPYGPLYAFYAGFSEGFVKGEYKVYSKHVRLMSSAVGNSFGPVNGSNPNVDTKPNVPVFIDQPKPNVDLSSEITSDPITVKGISVGEEVEINVQNGQYLINNLSWQDPGSVRYVKSGDKVRVRHTSSAQYGTKKETILIIGSGLNAVKGKFSSTTKKEKDSTPSEPSFVSQLEVPLSDLRTSNAITVSGIEGSVPIRMEGEGKYRVNKAGDWGRWARNDDTVSNNNIVEVRHTSSGTFGTSVESTLFINGTKKVFTFTSTTKTSDITNGPGFYENLQRRTNNTVATDGTGGTGGTGDEPLEHTGFIRGNIYEAYSTKSIAQAELNFSGPSSITVKTTVNGTYSAELAEGEYQVSVNDGDYEDVIFNIVITEGITSIADISMLPSGGNCVAGSNIVKTNDRNSKNGGSNNVDFLFKGNVQDIDSNEPISQAELNFSGPSSETVETTDSGTYTVKLLEGEYQVTVNDSEHEEVTFNITMTKGVTFSADIRMLPSGGNCETDIATDYKAIILAGTTPLGSSDESVSPVDGLGSQFQTTLTVLLREGESEKKVWVSILPPVSDFSENTAVDGLLQVKLKCEAGKCEKSYNNFSINGSYRLNFFAEDNAGKASLLRTIEIDQTKADLKASSADIIYQVRNGLLSLKDVEVAGEHYWVELQHTGDWKFKVTDFFQLTGLVSQHPVRLSDDGITLSLPRVYLYDSEEYYSLDLENIGDFEFEAKLETLRAVD